MKHPRITTAPARNTYHMVRRSDNGLPYAPFPGTLITLDEYDTRLELIRSESSNRGLWHPCAHVVRTVMPIVPVTQSDDLRSQISGVSGATPYYVWAPTYLQALWDGLHWSGSITDAVDQFGPAYAPFQGLTPLYTGLVETESFRPIRCQSRPDAIAKSLEAMLPGIKDDLSAVNSIIELKDFKSVTKFLRKIQGTLNLAGLKPARFKDAAGTLRELVRTGSEGLLQMKFNFQPLLADLSALGAAIDGLSKELEELRKRAGKPQKRHYSTNLVEEYTDIDSTQACCRPTFFKKPSSTITARRHVQYVTKRFNATIEYEYTLPRMSELEYQLKGWMDKLGVRLNPTIIWNAIPWSFVVDWFLGIGRWLSQFKGANIAPKVLIRNYCHTVKVERVINTYLYLDSVQYAVARVREKSYDRVIGFDNFAYAFHRTLKHSGLNSSEFSLATALALSR